MEILTVPADLRNDITLTREYIAADRCLTEAERIAMRGYHGHHGGVYSGATVQLLDGGVLLVSRTAETFTYEHSATRVVGDEVALERDEAVQLLMKGLRR